MARWRFSIVQFKMERHGVHAHRVTAPSGTQAKCRKRFWSRYEPEQVRSPVPTPTAPVTAAAEKEQQYDDNQDQFYEKRSKRVMALFAAHRVLQSADGVLHFSRSRRSLTRGGDRGKSPCWWYSA
jgi:adenosylmethionine-8-amino-7-oxononanoate aminotransferase